MAGWRDALDDPERRAALGRRIEHLTEEVFHVLRWSTAVGFVRYLALDDPRPLLSVLYWVLAGFLFAWLASRFLLRPEVAIFGPTPSGWRRGVQTGLNFLLCVGVFGLVLWGVNVLVEALGALRAGASI